MKSNKCSHHEEITGLFSNKLKKNKDPSYCPICREFFYIEDDNIIVESKESLRPPPPPTPPHPRRRLDENDWRSDSKNLKLGMVRNFMNAIKGESEVETEVETEEQVKCIDCKELTINVNKKYRLWECYNCSILIYKTDAIKLILNPPTDNSCLFCDESHHVMGGNEIIGIGSDVYRVCEKCIELPAVNINRLGKSKGENKMPDMKVDVCLGDKGTICPCLVISPDRRAIGLVNMVQAIIESDYKGKKKKELLINSVLAEMKCQDICENEGPRGTLKGIRLPFKTNKS